FHARYSSDSDHGGRRGNMRVRFFRRFRRSARAPKAVLGGNQEILPHSTSDQLTGRISAHDKTWEDWVQRTGELPPDFASMPSHAELPAPLRLPPDGKVTRVKTRERWTRQRRWIRSQFEQWVFGKMPPAPDNVRAVVTATRREGRVTVRDVRLEF